jgi:putative ABC transport system permease protein
MFAFRTPLAWQNLTSSRGKLLLSATGVGFAVLLMFMQIGFRNALLDSNAHLISLFDADLVVVSQARYNLSSERRFSRALFDSVGSVSGVRETCPVRAERVQAVVQVEGHRARSIRVVAIDPVPEFLRDQRLVAALASADMEGGALVDRRSKRSYGFAVQELDTLREQHVELNGRRLPIHGAFTLGTDFANDGTLLMSNRIFPGYFPYRSPTRDPMDLVDMGLVQLQPGSDPATVARQIEMLGREEIDVFTMRDFLAREIRFWSRNTPIGVIFGIGTLMGLIVGAIICYQIQFTEISDNMPELATLRAMGYGPGYFWGLVLSQSFYLACLGFVPGFLISWGLFGLLAEASGLVMRLTLGRILFVWGLTLVMCTLSGLFALRKLWRADPATLF